MAAVAAACALSATYHVNTFFVSPQVQELAFLRSRLESSVGGGGEGTRIWSVTIIPPRHLGTFAPFVMYEFGLPSSSIPWAARAVVPLLVRNMVSDPEISVTVARVDEKPADPPDLVIDMREVALRPAEAGHRW